MLDGRSLVIGTLGLDVIFQSQWRSFTRGFFQTVVSPYASLPPLARPSPLNKGFSNGVLAAKNGRLLKQADNPNQGGLGLGVVSEGLLAGLRVPKTGVATTVGHTGLGLIAFSLGKKRARGARPDRKVKIEK